MNENSLTLEGCHVPLTVFYRPVKAVLEFSTKTIRLFALEFYEAIVDEAFTITS